jgi:hypothetical protein
LSDELIPGSGKRIDPPDDSDTLDEPAEERSSAGRDTAVREGLPRGYRLRADKHYVDQLAGPLAAQPVRMLSLAQIESDEPLPRVELRRLIESIRVHGIVHPLIVRRHGPRYSVIAGRRRLAVAHTLRLSNVPCIVHDLDEAQAAALAMADNLTTHAASQDSERSPMPVAIRQVIADHLATIRTCADAIAGKLPAMSRSVFDLIRAHSWRAARLGDALDLILDAPPVPGRDRSLSTIVDDVIEGFEPESRLNDFTIRAHVRDDLSLSGLNAHELLAGLSAALLATLPLVEHAIRPTVLIKGAPGGSGSVVIDVAQTDVDVPAGLARHYFDGDAPTMRPGGTSAVAGALAAKALAERYAGTATFEAVPGGGSTLKMLLVRRS